MNRATVEFVVAVAVFAVAVAGYWAWYGAVSAQSARVATLRADIAAKKNSLTQAASMRETLGSLSTEEAAMRQYFVSESTIVDFIGSLQSQGQKLGAIVTVNSVSADTHGARPLLTLSLTIDGTFDSVMRTIGTIENAPYDIQTVNLSLLNKAKGAWEAQFTITVGSVPGGVSGSVPQAQTGTGSSRPAAAANGAQPL